MAVTCTNPLSLVLNSYNGIASPLLIPCASFAWT